MEYIDSHCHLNLMKFEDPEREVAEAVASAQSVGVTQFLCVGTTLLDSQEAIDIAEAHSPVYASVGVHPSERVEDLENLNSALIELANHPKVIAIGETGLDYHYNDTGLDAMRQQFRQHIAVAKALSKPMIIHTRSAQEDTLEIMASERASDAGGIMHCFTESWEMAKSALDMGFYISISGIVTFKNAQQVADVAKAVPLDRLLIETDSPYLAPVPYRGKKNYPAYVVQVADKIAALRGVSVERLAEATSENFRRLFPICSM